MELPLEKVLIYCDRNQITHTTYRCFAWLILKSPGFDQVYEIDFHEFNEWQGRNHPKGKFALSQLKYVRDRVLKIPCIRVVKKIKAHEYQLEILTFDVERQIEQLNIIDYLQDIKKEGDPRGSPSFSII